MRKTIILTFLLIIVFSTNIYSKQKRHKEKTLINNIDSLLKVENNKPFNGVILIAENGKTLYSTSIGFSDLNKRSPLKINNQFVIGSISKQFTATIVLQEFDKGHLDLHTPIRQYLNNLSESWADTVTVHHLLSHTHGIVALDKSTKFSVGTAYDYSQIGYDLLAQIVEYTSGKSFASLSADLFKACNMDNTSHPESKNYNKLGKGYVENNLGELIYTNESLKQYPAAGAFISMAKDLVSWNQNLFEGALLKESTFQLMTTKQDNAVRKHPIFGHTEYGYGITIDNNDGITQWGQTGYAPGFACMSFYFPQNKVSVIVLENVNYDLFDLKKMYYYHTQILDMVRKYAKDKQNNY